MGGGNALVGGKESLLFLKEKLAHMPQALSNLIRLETGSAGIKAYRPVCGEHAMLLLELNQRHMDHANERIKSKSKVDWRF